MTDSSAIKLPVYAKLTFIIIGIIGLFYILYIGQEILLPVIFAVVIAILLNPVVNFLINKKVNRVVAILLALLLVMLVSGGLGYFIGSQLALFSDTFPKFKEKFTVLEHDTIQWVSSTFNISNAKINAWIAETKKSINGTAIIGQTLSTLKGLLVLLILPVYTFLILFYKPLILEFISQLFKNDEKGVVKEVLTESKSLIQNYLVGLAIEAVIVAILNSVGLLIIGVEYAVLLGLIGALLNIIPYIGGVIAISLPMLVALATQSPSAALWVFVVYIVVQFIDNNFIVPHIVASKVKINALISILVVLIGGALWGVPGMFLSIPLTAIIKVIFDRIEPLKPFGLLLGDHQPGVGNAKKKRTTAK
ncbi:MAG: AI-2E family transporter [Cyclobacteriaceae bacterium]|nr:AI-2E family transporter [Cyclobacteriaceae bacterium]